MTFALESDARRTHRDRRWWIPALFIAVPVGLGALVGFTVETGSWYDTLDKAPLNPPSAVFGPVWTVLYVMIGLAGYLAWSAADDDQRTVLGVWSVQLALNLAWTPIFFGLEAPGWALVEIVMLIVAIVATIGVFRRYSHLAAALLVPYLCWTLFATYLTASIVIRN